VHNIARRTLILAGIVASLCTAAAGQAIAFVLPEKAADTAFVDMIIERLRKHVTGADRLSRWQAVADAGPSSIQF